nr:hypothetical protein [uncultured Lachnoclostridium sp.]
MSNLTTDLNMANRQCCDLDIRDYKTKEPWMFADFCNTTTANISADAVYANKKGAKCIKFDNPLEGTITMEFQVSPFRIYAMLSDGEIETSAIIARREDIAGEAEGVINLTKTPVSGSVFVVDSSTGKTIAGNVEAKKFTATTTSEIVVGTTYEVSYLEEKNSGVKRVSFNNKKVPKDFFIQMVTNNRDENGDEVAMRLTAYKASPQRNFELSFASDGDPSSVTLTCDLMTDRDGNVLDMVEILEDEK